MPVVSSVKKFLKESANIFRYQSAAKFHMKNVRRAMRTNVEKLQEMFLTRLPNTDVFGLRELSMMTNIVDYYVPYC